MAPSRLRALRPVPSSQDEPRGQPEASLGSEAVRLDAHFATQGLSPEVRTEVWSSSARILAHGPIGSTRRSSTGVAVGYVQSGKTTNFTALIGLAADAGYRVVVAMLGSTNLLLEQNERRLVGALGLEERWDYRWVKFTNPSPASLSPNELAHYLAKGRTVLITLLKHHGRIQEASRVLTREVLGEYPSLVVDDEADQISLNTRIREGAESATYAAIRGLRAGLGPHIYVQYTATPYAPLLLEVEDFLSPDFVELLRPGPGYVGGREIFVENRSLIVREVGDAPRPSVLPTSLPASLRDALADFVVGAALLLAVDERSAPVSMLIHPTGRTDPQRRYEFLVDKVLARWRRQLRGQDVGTPYDFQSVRDTLVRNGCPDVSDDAFARALIDAVDEATLWRVNSAEDAAERVNWNVAPVHVLIGGNKLDRGFTVEGLTVTWLGRAPSNQVDTMVQRARAYGYRRSYLPYCRIYGSRESINALASGVVTELDTRSRLREWTQAGLPVNQWATEVGVVVGSGLRPTRSQVIRRLAEFRPGWHVLSRPSPSADATQHNLGRIQTLGLDTAPRQSYGRLSHRTLSDVSPHRIRSLLLDEWQLEYSPGWDRGGLKAWLRRMSASESLTVVYLTADDGGARVREWDPQMGFEQLMQGRDRVAGPDSYPGDRNILPGEPQFQVHLVRPRESPAVSMLALAAFVPSTRRIVRRDTDPE